MTNQPLRTIIVDDEPQAIANLEALLKPIPEIKVVATISDSARAVEIVLEKKPDLLFLDIQMPEKTGFEIVRELADAGEAPAIIFATGFDEFAIESDWSYSGLFFNSEKSELASMNRQALLIKDGQEYTFRIPLLNIRKLERFLQ
ncbi:MAG: response regulator [Bacteroidales bacterium]|nr:response regulator [Bacteroidales bacterium]